MCTQPNKKRKDSFFTLQNVDFDQRIDLTFEELSKFSIEDGEINFSHDIPTLIDPTPEVENINLLENYVEKEPQIQEKPYEQLHDQKLWLKHQIKDSPIMKKVNY